MYKKENEKAKKQDKNNSIHVRIFYKNSPEEKQETTTMSKPTVFSFKL